DGSHALTYTLTDAAGNESEASSDLTLTIDTVAPEAPSAAPAGFLDDGGNLVSGTDAKDNTPSLLVGKNLTDTPTLYVDGNKVAAIYNAEAGTLTPTTA
ncbi:hypothetical protein, partial [Marinomonas arctica]